MIPAEVRVLILALASCFLIPQRSEGRRAFECADGADNDGDGLFDCDDPDCSGSPDCPNVPLPMPTTPPPAPTDTSGPPPTTAPGSGDTAEGTEPPVLEVEVEAFTLVASFGWDPQYGFQDVVTSTGTTSPPLFSIILYDGTLDSTCAVSLDLTGFGLVVNPANAQWEIDIPTGLQGPTIPGGTKTLLSNCDTAGFTDAQYTNSSLLDYWGSQGYTLRILDTPLEPDVADYLWPAAGTEGFAVTMRTDNLVFDSGLEYATGAYARAWSRDASGALAIDAKTGDIVAPPILQADVAESPAGNLPPGVYDLRLNGVFVGVPDQLSL